jgi:hypothetical protein
LNPCLWPQELDQGESVHDPQNLLVLGTLHFTYLQVFVPIEFTMFAMKTSALAYSWFS